MDRLGSAWLGPPRLGPARLGSALALTPPSAKKVPKWLPAAQCIIHCKNLGFLKKRAYITEVVKFTLGGGSGAVWGHLGPSRPGPARIGSARLGRLRSAGPGPARLGSARIGSARIGSSRLGSANSGVFYRGSYGGSGGLFRSLSYIYIYIYGHFRKHASK